MQKAFSTTLLPPGDSVVGVHLSSIHVPLGVGLHRLGLAKAASVWMTKVRSDPSGSMDEASRNLICFPKQSLSFPSLWDCGQLNSYDNIQ